MPAASGEVFGLALCFPRRLASHSGILQRPLFSFHCSRMWVSMLNRIRDHNYKLPVLVEANVIVMCIVEQSSPKGINRLP